MSAPPPVACCRGASDYQTRIAWVESLTRRALRSHARDDLVLYLCYAPDAAADVQTMVEQERICCPFLAFDLDVIVDAVRVTITAPEATRDAVDMLFGQFLSGLRAA